MRSNLNLVGLQCLDHFWIVSNWRQMIAYHARPWRVVVNDELAEKVVEVPLAKGANADAEDPHGRTPLHVATRDGRAELVALLLSHGGCRNASSL